MCHILFFSFSSFFFFRAEFECFLKIYLVKLLKRECLTRTVINNSENSNNERRVLKKNRWWSSEVCRVTRRRFCRKYLRYFHRGSKRFNRNGVNAQFTYTTPGVLWFSVNILLGFLKIHVFLINDTRLWTHTYDLCRNISSQIFHTIILYSQRFYYVRRRGSHNIISQQRRPKAGWIILRLQCGGGALVKTY